MSARGTKARQEAPLAPPAARKLRCAVYTRKSSEEGLEQAFNSLDAQREACEAYVLSQRAEGWLLVPDRYDDGGVSGGTLERPALRRLLADIEAGRVDVVVVYKIDRLSRALMDFARLVEVFDRHQVTFVSVTQAFNTTTSMGRLTLNVLLSFAQFEREVIGERIRDKFAASRRKGMWMGGTVPFGYVVRDRKLVIHEEQAATVRTIFERFAKVGSATTLAAGAGQGRRADTPRQADRQGLPLQAAHQPGLRRRGGPQGHGIPRRAPGDRHAGAVGQGARRPGGEPAQARRRHADLDAGLAEGADLRPDRLRHVADPHPQGRPALPLLRQPGRAEAGAGCLPGGTAAGGGDRGCGDRPGARPAARAGDRGRHLAGVEAEGRTA